MSVRGRAVGPVLLERGAVLAEVAAAFAAAGRGEPSVLVVTGAPGAGKSAVLDASRAAAAEGVTVLTAVCDPLEQDYAFGAVRQLLRRQLTGGAAAPPSLGVHAAAVLAGGADLPDVADPFAVLDALYWTLVGLTDAGPVALLVDDAHWCDEPSLRWLGFLSRRLTGLPVVLLLTTRPAGAERDLLAQLAAGAHVRHLALHPLSRPAAAELLQQRSGVEVAEPLADRCHQLTQGNPFYLAVLARALREAGADALEQALGRDVWALPDTVRRAVTSRVRALGEPALALARAIAVLGPDATAGLAATLARLPAAEASELADALVAAGILRRGQPLRFEHPLVHAAVYDDLGAVRSGELHKEAARLLAARAAGVGRVASHLVVTEPGDDLWVVESLVAGARAALREGAPETAARYLRRAAQEPVARRRPELLLALGQAEFIAGQPACLESLRAALDLAEDDRLLVSAAQALARALAYHGRIADAVDVLERARDRLDGAEQDLRGLLDLDVSATGALDLTTLDRADAALARCVAHDNPALGRLVLAHRSVESARYGRSAAEAARMARAALADGPLLSGSGLDDMGAHFPVVALFLADELDEARRHLTAAAENARSRGSVAALCMATMWRSHVALRAGDVVDAGVDAEAALALAQVADLRVFLPYALAFLTDVHVERGELDDAERLWREPGLDDELPLLLPANYMLFSRGCLHVARGRIAAAARDLLESGRRQQVWRAPGPGFWPWASRAALALNLLGQTDQARELVEDELDRARAFGAARPVGIALRARALLEQGVARVRLLEQSREALATSPARLEQARTDVDLGAALIRVGRTSAGVDVLQQAVRTATACGATALVEQGRAELSAAGVRSRATAVHGVDALTISERRVAELARQGLTNREIARALFVTPKTVETHLSRVFRKLAVTSRHELAAVEGLGGEPVGE